MASLAYLLSLVLLALPVVLAAALERARKAPHIFGRQEFIGGWPIGLPGTAVCPDSTNVTCKSDNAACCPSGTQCSVLRAPYCCPPDVSCISVLDNFPQCADPSWTLYLLRSGGLYQPTYFCCPPGQFGVLPITGAAGFCRLEGESVPATRLASKITGAKVTVLPTIQSATTRSTVTTTKALSSLSSSATAESADRSTTSTTSPNSRTSSASVIPNDSTASLTSNTPKDSNSPSPTTVPSSSLGPGATAGIVIGSLGVLALFLILAFMLYQRRKPSHPTVMETREVETVEPVVRKEEGLEVAKTGPGFEVVPVVVSAGETEREPPPPADWVLKSEVDGRDGRVEIGLGR